MLIFSYITNRASNLWTRLKKFNSNNIIELGKHGEFSDDKVIF